MTKLINKDSENINLYFTLDRDIEGDVKLIVVSDYTNNELYIDLGNPDITNSRYTLFILANPFKGYTDGLYSYELTDGIGQLETGSIKIQSDDFGQPNDFKEIDNDGDDFIVIED